MTKKNYFAKRLHMSFFFRTFAADLKISIYIMSQKEIQRRVRRMQEIADEYTSRTGNPVNPTFLAAMQTQGCITILNPRILD